MGSKGLVLSIIVVMNIENVSRLRAFIIILESRVV